MQDYVQNSRFTHVYALVQSSVALDRETLGFNELESSLHFSPFLFRSILVVTDHSQPGITMWNPRLMIIHFMIIAYYLINLFASSVLGSKPQHPQGPPDGTRADRSPGVTHIVPSGPFQAAQPQTGPIHVQSGSEITPITHPRSTLGVGQPSTPQYENGR